MFFAAATAAGGGKNEICDTTISGKTISPRNSSPKTKVQDILRAITGGYIVEPPVVDLLPVIIMDHFSIVLGSDAAAQMQRTGWGHYNSTSAGWTCLDCTTSFDKIH